MTWQEEGASTWNCPLSTWYPRNYCSSLYPCPNSQTRFCVIRFWKTSLGVCRYLFVFRISSWFTARVTGSYLLPYYRTHVPLPPPPTYCFCDVLVITDETRETLWTTDSQGMCTKKQQPVPTCILSENSKHSHVISHIFLSRPILPYPVPLPLLSPLP